MTAETSKSRSEPTGLLFFGFAKAGNDGWVPVAVLGFEREENLFIDGHGHWTADYVPAFVRRYPFILAESEVDRDRGTWSAWTKPAPG